MIYRIELSVVTHKTLILVWMYSHKIPNGVSVAITNHANTQTQTQTPTHEHTHTKHRQTHTNTTTFI